MLWLESNKVRHTMKYTIHRDGSFDILGDSIRLHGCYPALDGSALRPLRVETADDAIVYLLSGGIARLSFRTDGERLAIDCSADGLAGIHDLAPVGSAALEQAENVYVQGFGMEGPSGCFALTEDAPASHGLTALYTGERVLLVYAEDHRRYSAAFQAKKTKTPFGEHISFSGGFNLEGTAGERVTLPTLYFEEMVGLAAGLRHCAERIAAAMGARHTQPPAFFWSSWYHAYETMDQATLEDTLAGIRTENVPFRYIELDAGYMPHLGDWLTPNHRWPGGLQKAAETILAAGYQPGIWVAPFIVGDRSALYREHPDWVLRDPDGKPHVQLHSYTEPKIWGNPDCDYYVLDTSHPDALAYIENVFKTLKSWGFSLFKTDFMLWSMHDTSTVLRHDPSLTSVEIMRKTLSVIRGAIGEDSYLLGCIAPFMPFIGYADGMRLAGDCGAQWAVPYGPVNMLRELPCDNYFNHVFWQNDPDAMLLRDFDTMLTDTEARSLALLQALSGGVVSTSDPIARLSEDRKRLLRLVEPRGAVTPALPQFGKRRSEILLTHKLPQGNLLFAMNPTDAPLTVFCRLSEVFGEENLYQYQYDWEEDGVASTKDDVFAARLTPHGSALVFVTREPLREKPSNLWRW